MATLEFKNISKTFLNTHALSNVDLIINPGEVHALCGENGAGKSTLIKVLAGVYKPDDNGGAVIIDGEEIKTFTPIYAQQKGVSVMYQELDLVPTLTAVQNILLGKEPMQNNKIFIDSRKAGEFVKNLFRRLNLSVPLDVPVRELSIAEQQIVMIAKALSADAKILVMDEPTAVLGDKDVKLLFDIVKDLKKTGISVIYISHRLEEIFEIADTVTVLRDGRKIHTDKVSEITKKDLIKYMVGRELVADDIQKVNADPRNPVIEVRGVSTDALHDVSVELYKGEILGVAGLVGSGRTELARAILGIDKIKSGTVSINGRKVVPKIKNAIKENIGYVPESRKTEGLLLNLDVLTNGSIATVGPLFSKGGFINKKREAKETGRALDKLNVVPKEYTVMIKNLSGGNQQKVVLAKWLVADSKILIIDEPTRGIDVGAKEEIYNIMYALRDRGYSIFMISSDLPEVIRISDRVVVMAHGRISGMLSSQELTEEGIMTLAT